jgi:hypothetical protein
MKSVQIKAEYNQPLDNEACEEIGKAPWVRIASSVQAWQDAH